ncbi:MAG: hypothetical protein IT373_20345 [Polyangiaceae bacterium]|nr:hypothetical protein [Polyangiaceae bacterium]
MRASILAPLALALGLVACAQTPCPCAAHGGPPPGPPPGHPGGPEHGGPPPGPPPGHWGPPGPGGPGPMGPPPEALAACKDLAADAACKVVLPERSIEGTCRKGPDADKPLACAPAHMPPPP